MLHEELRRDEPVSGSTNRSVGLVFAVVFALIGFWPLWSRGPVRSWALGIAGALVLVALAAPRVLGPLNRAWMALGLALHRIISPVALGVMFYGVITPFGWAMRLLRRDPLRLKRPPDAPSYWVRRDPPGPPPDSLNNQF
jgi:hypothetical protein